MKTLLILTISTLIAGFAHAQFEFPRGTFKFSELDQAKTAAAAGKKDIAFVYTNDKSTCPLCIGASESFVDAVKSKAVIVYLDSTDTKNLWGKLPGKVREGLTAGNIIPKIVVTDAMAEKLVASLNYETYTNDSRKAIRDLKKAMKAE